MYITANGKATHASIHRWTTAEGFLDIHSYTSEMLVNADYNSYMITVSVSYLMFLEMSSLAGDVSLPKLV